jgi:hypothetical protein
MATQITKNTSFFYICKENYFQGILPADPESREKDGYKTVVQIARTYFSAGLYEPIVQYLSEGRYFVKLWSAYLILEYGNPTESLRNSCIEIIQNTVSQFSNELPPKQEEFFKAYLEGKSGVSV